MALEQTSDTIHVHVADQGIGIPVADQAFLCEQFYRGRNIDSLKTSGFGIGLYVASEILHHHDGLLQVESTEGVGSTFTVVLPRLHAAADIERALPASEEPLEQRVG